MRPVRPTVKVLLQLPTDGFDDPQVAQLISRRDPTVLEQLDQICHPILNAARAALADGRRCEHHRAATKAAKQTVYEIEERSSGWRGAVILDSDGDPWLVYVDEHDKFHRKAGDVLKADRRRHWAPGKADYEMRQREDHAQADQTWRGDMARVFLTLLDEALSSSQPSTRSVPPLPAAKSSNSNVQLSLSLEHDAVIQADDETTAHDRDTLAEITLRITGARHQPLHDMLIQVLARLLDPELRTAQPTYLTDGSGLLLMVTMSQAHLIELVALLHADTPDPLQDTVIGTVERTHRHYIREDLMTSKVVNGEAARAVCGAWFIPIQYGEQLPICSDCEHRRPIAQAVIDMIREAQA